MMDDAMPSCGEGNKSVGYVPEVINDFHQHRGKRLNSVNVTFSATEYS